MLHPLRFPIGGSQKAGAVAGNAALLVSLTLGHWLLVQLYCLAARGIPKLRADEEVKGPPEARLRFPAVGIIAGTVLYAGTTNSATWLLFRFDRVGADKVVVGAIGTALITLLSPYALWRVVLRHIGARAVYEREIPPASCLRRTLLGEGDWVSRSKDGPYGMWLERWGNVIKPLSERHPVSGMLEKLLTAAVVSTLQSVPRDECAECAAVDALTAVVLLASAAAVLRLQSHARVRDNCAFAGCNALQGLSMAIRAVHHGVCERETHMSVQLTLFGAGMLLLCKAVVDVCCALYEALTSRHTSMFRQYLSRVELLSRCIEDNEALESYEEAPWDDKLQSSGKEQLLATSLIKDLMGPVTPLRDVPERKEFAVSAPICSPSNPVSTMPRCSTVVRGRVAPLAGVRQASTSSFATMSPGDSPRSRLAGSSHQLRRPTRAAAVHVPLRRGTRPTLATPRNSSAPPDAAPATPVIPMPSLRKQKSVLSAASSEGGQERPVPDTPGWLHNADCTAEHAGPRRKSGGVNLSGIVRAATLASGSHPRSVPSPLTLAEAASSARAERPPAAASEQASPLLLVELPSAVGQLHGRGESELTASVASRRKGDAAGTVPDAGSI